MTVASNGEPVVTVPPATNSARRRASGRLSAAIAAPLVLAVGGALLGYWLAQPSRSVDAYCKTFFARGAEFRGVYQDPANQNFGWGQVSAVLSAPQRLSDLFAALDQVAPDEIEPEVASLRDGFAKVSDSMVANGTGGLVGMATALAQGVAMQPAWDRVNSWTTDKCGPPPSS